MRHYHRAPKPVRTFRIALQPRLDTPPEEFRFLFWQEGRHDRHGAPLYRVEVRCGGRLIFADTRYRPSPIPVGPPYSVAEMRLWAENMASFALAYLERPEEFSRVPEDLEQVHRAVWEQYADELGELGALSTPTAEGVFSD